MASTKRTPLPLANHEHGTAEAINEASALASAKAAGQAALKPALGPLPAKSAIVSTARYAVALSRAVEYRGRTLTPGQTSEMIGQLLLDDTIRGAIRACAKLG